MLRATQLRHTVRRKFGGHADQTKPFEPPHVEAWHTYTGEAFMTVMWLWLFYKFEHDGPIVFVSRTALSSICMPLFLFGGQHFGTVTQRSGF